MHDTLMMKTVFRCCCLLYGVFSIRHFAAMATHKVGGQLTESSLKQIWGILLDMHHDVKPLDDQRLVVYCTADLKTKKEAASVWEKVKNLKHWLPTPEEIDRLDLYSLPIARELLLDLLRLCSTCSWYYMHDPERIVRDLIAMLHQGIEPAKAVNCILDRMYAYSRSDGFRKQATQLLTEIRATLPMIHLGGYSIQTFAGQQLGDPLALLPDKR